MLFLNTASLPVPSSDVETSLNQLRVFVEEKCLGFGIILEESIKQRDNNDALLSGIWCKHSANVA
jgi:hypothetical protein